jgi:hypothetical protein
VTGVLAWALSGRGLRWITLGGLVAALWVQCGRLDAADATIQGLRADAQIRADQLVKAHALAVENGRVGVELRDRLAALVEERRADLARREAELALRDQDLARARASADRLRRDLNAAFSTTQGCEALRATRVDSCAAVAERLRERAGGPAPAGHP